MDPHSMPNQCTLIGSRKAACRLTESLERHAHVRLLYRCAGLDGGEHPDEHHSELAKTRATK